MQHLLQLQQYLQAQQSLQSAATTSTHQQSLSPHLGLSYSHPGAPSSASALTPQVHHHPQQQQQYLYYNPSHIATPSNMQLNFFQHSSNTSTPQYFLSSSGIPDAQSLQFMPFASFIPPAQLQQQQQQQQQQQSPVVASSSTQQQQQPSSQQPQPTSKQPTQAKQQPQQRPPVAAQQQQTTATATATATTASPSQKPHEFIHQTPQQMRHSAPQYKRRFNLSRAPKENQKYVVVTEELLKMRQGDAAEKLNMKPSTLSKRWKNSLPERSWPYRTNQKLDKQIKKLQELQQKGYDVLSDLQKLSNLREENLRPAVIIINDKGDHKNGNSGSSNNTVTSPPSNAASPPSNPTSPTTTSPPQQPFSFQQQAQQLPPQQLQQLQNPLKYGGSGVKGETVGGGGGGGGLQIGNRPDEMSRNQLSYMTPQQQQQMMTQRTMPNTLGSVKVETSNKSSAVVPPQQQQQYKNNTTQLEPDDAEEDDDDEEYEEEEDYDESGSGSPSD